MEKICIFISPCKTSAISEDGNCVQKLRTNMCLPGVFVLGSLQQEGYTTHFLDLTTEDWGHQRIVGNSLLAYGLSSSEAVERIANLKANYVLITSMFSFEYMMVDELVREITKSLPQVTVILGGIHASAKPEWHFEESNPDFIVIGEGEQTTVELMAELSQPNPDPRKVPGIAFRDSSGQIIKTAKRELLCDLDLPWAVDKVLRNLDGSMRYIEGMSRKAPVYVDDHIGEDVSTATLFGSRGCSGSCLYCASTPRTGHNIRHIGADRMFSYFLKLRQEYGVAVFSNQSDTFGIHSEDLEFLRQVKNYRTSTGDTSFIINNPNAFFLAQLFEANNKCEIKRDFLELLRDSGFNTITIAIETLNQRFNGKVNWKTIQPEIVLELCQAVQEMGFKTDIYMMYGFPGQTKAEFNEDLNFGRKLNSYVDLLTWNGLSLLPGTRYYEEYVEKPGREDAYRQVIRDGYGVYCGQKELNLSQVDGQYYKDALEEFGKGWI